MVSLVEPEINEKATVSNLYKAIVSLENVGKPIPSTKVAKLLNDQLLKDDSFLSAGLSLQIASKLARNDQLQFVNRISKLIALADEVDGKYLQYEGGLGITASIFKGILDLSTAANKTTGLTDQQVLKFLNYFHNRLTVQTTKNAAELLQILKYLSNNKHHIPVVVSLYGSSVINEDNTNIVLKVTNSFGTSLAKEFRITAKANDLSNVLKFTVVQGDSSLYAVDILQSKLPAGKYNLKITVEPVKADKLLVISNDITFNAIIQSKVNLDSIEIGIGEKDQFAIKHEPVEYPISLKKKLECDNTQKISIKYCVRSLIQSKDLTVQQSAIHFVNEKTNEDIIFIADQDRISKVYNKDINLAYRGKDFNYQSGDYLIKIVVGDSLISESISWTLGKVNIQFNQEYEEDTKSIWLNKYKAKPEISHLFREAEPRPSEFISYAFTVLSLLPALVLAICWSKIGINFKSFKFSLSAIVFHGCLFLVFTLYTLFFIRLNMFTTIKCLSGVLVALFLSGHYLLKDLRSNQS